MLVRISLYGVEVLITAITVAEIEYLGTPGLYLKTADGHRYFTPMLKARASSVIFTLLRRRYYDLFDCGIESMKVEGNEFEGF